MLDSMKLLCNLYNSHNFYAFLVRALAAAAGLSMSVPDATASPLAVNSGALLLAVTSFLSFS